MAQRRRPTADQRPPLPGLDEPYQQQPLARGGQQPPARRAAQRPAPRQQGAGRVARSPGPAAQRGDAPAAGDELQLGFGEILVSLPVAIGMGQMLIDQSLDAMPWVAGWTVAVIAYKTATTPGIVRGLLDWTADSISLPAELRQRLGVPDELPRVAPPPQSRGAWGFVDGLAADVRNLRAAVDARRGIIEGQFTVEDEDGPAGQEQPRPARAAPANGAPVAAPNYGAYLDAATAPAPDWLHEVNGRPNENPHLAVVGPSGSGKSTIVLAALGRRPGDLVICTIKSEADDPWGGFPAVRLSFGPSNEPDFRPIAAAISAVYAEMNARHADGARPRTPLTLVVDEFTTISDELQGLDLQRKFIRMWISGRSVGVRVIVMDPTINVKGWGIEGRGDVRESLLFIRCNRDKSAYFFEWDAARNQPFNKRPIDTRGMPELAAAGLDPARVWVPPPPGRRAAAAGPAPAPRRAASGLSPEDEAVVAKLRTLQSSPAPAPQRPPTPAYAASAEPPELPLPANVIRLADRRPRPAQSQAQATAPAEGDLLASLLGGEAVAQPAPAPTSQLDPKVAAVLRSHGVTAPLPAARPTSQPAAPPAPPASPAQSVTVDQPGGGQVIVNVQQTAAGRGGSGRRRPPGVRSKRPALSAEDLAKLPQVRALMDAGHGKVDAIRQTYGVSGGDRYSVIARALDDPAA